MRTLLLLAAALLAVPAQDPPARHVLRWKVAKDRRLVQEVTLKGESELYGKAGLRLSLRQEFTGTSDDTSQWKAKLVRVQGESGGLLALKLDYQEGAWKAASIGPAGMEEPLGDLKLLAGKELDLTFYRGDDVVLPADLFKPMIQLQVGLFPDARVPGFASELRFPGYGLCLNPSTEEPDDLLKGPPVGAPWSSLDKISGFRFEKVEDKDGRRCAMISVRREEAAKGEPRVNLLEGTYWFALEEGFLARASLVSKCLKKGDPPQVQATYSVEVTTTFK